MAVILLVCQAIAAPLNAQGQQDLRRRAALTAGASLGDGETALALSAALGFELAARLGFEFELAYGRKLDFTLDLCPAPRICVLGGRLPVTGRTVSLVPHLVFDLVPASRRLQAYVQAGVGAGHIRQRYFFGPPVLASIPESPELTRSKAVLAFSAGGGAGFRLSRRLALSADVRSLHLFDEAAVAERFITPSGTLSTLRVGARVSWLF
jgi:hypothetical protein